MLIICFEYVCMNVHACTDRHTHTVPRRGAVRCGSSHSLPSKLGESTWGYEPGLDTIVTGAGRFA